MTTIRRRLTFWYTVALGRDRGRLRHAAVPGAAGVQRAGAGPAAPARGRSGRPLAQRVLQRPGPDRHHRGRPARRSIRASAPTSMRCATTSSWPTPAARCSRSPTSPAELDAGDLQQLTGVLDSLRACASSPAAWTWGRRIGNGRATSRCGWIGAGPEVGGVLVATSLSQVAFGPVGAPPVHAAHRADHPGGRRRGRLLAGGHQPEAGAKASWTRSRPSATAGASTAGSRCRSRATRWRGSRSR